MTSDKRIDYSQVALIWPCESLDKCHDATEKDSASFNTPYKIDIKEKLKHKQNRLIEGLDRVVDLNLKSWDSENNLVIRWRGASVQCLILLANIVLFGLHILSMFYLCLKDAYISDKKCFPSSRDCMYNIQYLDHINYCLWILTPGMSFIPIWCHLLHKSRCSRRPIDWSWKIVSIWVY